MSGRGARVPARNTSSLAKVSQQHYAPSLLAENTHQLQRNDFKGGLIDHRVSGVIDAADKDSMLATRIHSGRHSVDRSSMGQTDVRKGQHLSVSLTDLESSPISKKLPLILLQPSSGMTRTDLSALEKQYGIVDSIASKRLAIKQWLLEKDRPGLTRRAVQVCNDLLLDIVEPQTEDGIDQSAGLARAKYEERLLSLIGSQFEIEEDTQELESFLESGKMVDGGSVNAIPRRHTI